MKKLIPDLLVILIFGIYWNGVGCIFTGEEVPEDFTNIPKYGCRWEGGPTPSVNCTCRSGIGELYVQRGGIQTSSTWTIEINGCEQVRFGRDSVADLRNLRQLYLRNIPSLTFEESSLNWNGYAPSYRETELYDLNIPSLKILIENCNITSIGSHAFKGRINEIVIDKSTVDVIQPYAFTTLKQTRVIMLSNTNIKNFKLQGFKKFTTNNLEINNVTCNEIPSRAFSSITVNENFLIRSSRFDTVRPSAFVVENPTRFEVTNTEVQRLDGEAFVVKARGSVLFKNNRFLVIHDGAFKTIEPDRSEIYNELFITFDSNVFGNLTPSSLSINGFTSKVINLNLLQECDCEKLDNKISDFVDYYTEINCLNAGSYVSMREFKTSYCSILAGHTTAIVIATTVFALCLIFGIGLGIYYRKVYRSRKYGSEKGAQNKNLSLIVPDGRTYRETEVHVIVERADLLTTDL